jgi:hypothetical protein
MDITYKSNT